MRKIRAALCSDFSIAVVSIWRLAMLFNTRLFKYSEPNEV